jgi:hypothetical protein
MTQILAEQLRKDLEAEKQDLREEEAKIAELQKSTERRKESIQHLEGALNYYEGDTFSAQSSSAETKPNLELSSFPEVNQLQEEQGRKPKEMLKPEFQGFSRLADIVLSVLCKQQKPVSLEEMAQLIYDASPEEFARARNSLSSELRRGAAGTSPKWRKEGLNYVAL